MLLVADEPSTGEDEERLLLLSYYFTLNYSRRTALWPSREAGRRR
jgi:hypothetical protein